MTTEDPPPLPRCPRCGWPLSVLPDGGVAGLKCTNPECGENNGDLPQAR